MTDALDKFVQHEPNWKNYALTCICPLINVAFFYCIFSNTVKRAHRCVWFSFLDRNYSRNLESMLKCGFVVQSTESIQMIRRVFEDCGYFFQTVVIFQKNQCFALQIKCHGYTVESQTGVMWHWHQLKTNRHTLFSQFCWQKPNLGDFRLITATWYIQESQFKRIVLFQSVYKVIFLPL